MGTFVENPVFYKELRSHLLSRRQSRGARAATVVIAALMVALLYYACVRTVLRGHMEGRDLFAAISYVQLTLLVFLAPSLTANAITQEREQQTWNMLLLTRLTADEIVMGKLLARLAPAAILLAVFVPLGLFAVFMGGVPVSVLLLSYLLLAATGIFYGVIGLFCSWALRRTSVATSASSTVIAFLVVGTPLLFSLWSVATTGSGRGIEDFAPMWLNPYMAMAAALSDLGYGSASLSPAPLAMNLIACAAGTAALVASMRKHLARGPKELEQ
jgi:ABC-type transport system involved in multi-copper enzyme maturation permease subunit